jgi:hypothetical protein
MDVRARGLRRALGRFVALIVGFWMATVRVVLDDRGGHVHSKGRKVFAFLHGQQLGLLKLGHRRGLVTVVSHSLDGEMQARALGSLGFRIVRGSTSRGGAGALKGMVSEIRSGADAAIAVDGPRGPFGVPKPGAAFAAHATGASLVPLASASQNAIVLRRAWDRFEIPLPFSRVAVVVGEPVDAGAAASSPEVLASALSALRMRAEALASGKGFSS